MSVDAIQISLSMSEGTVVFDSNKLTGLRVEKLFNDHATIWFTGEVTEKKDTFLKMAFDEVLIDAKFLDGSSQGQPIFRGIVTKIQVQYNLEDRVYYVTIEGASLSILMDQNRVSRAFQYLSQTYDDLVTAVIAEYPKAVSNTGSYGNEILKTFTLQRLETDWNFLKRMAARHGTGLVPGANEEGLKFHLGLPELKERGVLAEIDPFHAAQKRLEVYNDLHAYQVKDLTEQDFVFFDLKTKEPFNIGDYVLLYPKNNAAPEQNIQLYVHHSSVTLEKSQLRFSCTVAPKNGFKQKPIINHELTGLSLEGKVIAAGGEEAKKDYLKVYLPGIDSVEEEEKLCWFPVSSFYAVKGNTGLYCLPEVGDSIQLFFPTTDEADAYIRHSVRRQESESERLQNPDIKYFRTAFGKELKFAPEVTTITGTDPSLQICLQQDGVVKIESPEDEDVILKADRNLIVKAVNNLAIAAKNMIVLDYKKGTTNRVILDKDELIVFKGRVNKIRGTGGKEDKPKPSNPTTPSSIAAKGSKNGDQADFYLDNSPAFPWYINEQAEMPDGVFTAKWKNFKGQTKYSWDITIKFDITQHFPKVLTLDDSKKPSWRKRVGMFGTMDITHQFTLDTITPTLKLRALLKEKKVNYCGDDVIVKVATMADGKKYQDELTGRILGKNPSLNDASNCLEAKISEMFTKVKKEHSDFPLIKEDAKIMRTVLFGNESGAKHFHEKSQGLIGLPLYGPPDGWGIMQADPPEREEAIWSWKENMEVIANRIKKEYIDEIYKSDDFKQLEDYPMTRWQWRMLLYRRYNGGWFWTWNKDYICWEWTGYDMYAYCLKSIRTEKKEFNINIDPDYEVGMKKGKVTEEALVDSLRTYAKTNWNIWYPQKNANGAYKNKYPEQYFEF